MEKVSSISIDGAVISAKVKGSVEAGETWITEMTNRELKEMVTLDKRGVH